MLFLYLPKYILRHQKKQCRELGPNSIWVNHHYFYLFTIQKQIFAVNHWKPNSTTSSFPLPTFSFQASAHKNILQGGGGKKNFSQSFFFPVDCYILAPIISNCFTAEPKQHSQQNHSLSIRKQSERLDAKEQRWDRHQPNRPRRNMALVLLSPGSPVGQSVNLW